MKNRLIQDYVEDFLTKHVKPDDIIIDATLGNGHDTAFIKNLGAKVIAFDIQMEAIKQAKQNLKDLDNIQLFNTSFIHMFDHVSSFKGVIFNLGYLPGGDKNITTKKEDTLFILNEIIKRMIKDTFVIITAYPGHKEGQVEAQAILQYIRLLDKDFMAYTFQIENRNQSPFVIVIEK